MVNVIYRGCNFVVTEVPEDENSYRAKAHINNDHKGPKKEWLNTEERKGKGRQLLLDYSLEGIIPHTYCCNTPLYLQALQDKNIDLLKRALLTAMHHISQYKLRDDTDVEIHYGDPSDIETSDSDETDEESV